MEGLKQFLQNQISNQITDLQNQFTDFESVLEKKEGTKYLSIIYTQHAAFKYEKIRRDRGVL